MLNSHPRRRADERGMIMLVVVLFVLMLGGLSMGLLTEGMAEKVAVTHRKTSLLALEICETGIVKAQSEIFSQVDAGTDGIGNTTGPFAGGTHIATAVQHPTLPNRWTVTASGTFDLSTRRVEVGFRRRAKGDFMEGLFSKQTMTINGNTTTDAYDSRSGTYASQATNNDGGGNYARGGGHIGSNGDITLNGSAIHVRGNAIPGPLHETDASGGPTVWGDTMARRREVVLPDVPLAEFEAALSTNNNVELEGGGGPGKKTFTYNAANYTLSANGSDSVVTLSGGTYFFTDVTLRAGARLEVTGPAKIYVTGDFDAAGGTLVNTSGQPQDMIVYAHPYPLPTGHSPGSSQVKFHGGADAAIAIYAPSADIIVGGNEEVYGSLVGDTITVLGDANFHYDVALGEVDGHGVVMIERLYWRDLAGSLR